MNYETSPAYTGIWWRSEDPQRRVPGELSRAGGRWQLRTIGLLQELGEPGIDAGGYYIESQTILGLCTSGPASLWACHQIAATTPGQRPENPDDQPSSQVWVAAHVVQGRAIGLTHRFRSATISITGLTEWWLAGTARIPREDNPEDLAPDRPDLYIEIEGWSVGLVVSGSSTWGHHSLHTTRETRLLVEYADGFTYDELYRRIVYPFRALLGMIFDRHVDVTSQSLQPVEATSEGETVSLVTATDQAAAVELGLRDTDQMLLSPDDVDPGVFIMRWLALSGRAVVPFGLFVGRGGHGGVLQMQVVEVVMAAETLHRALHHEVQPEPEIVTRMFTALPQGVLSNDESERLRVIITRSYGLNLEQRLRQLASDLSEPVTQWLLGQRDAGRWAVVAAAVRNALTHGLTPAHALHQDVEAMVAVQTVTRAIVELTLAIECGLPSEDALVERLQRNDRFVALKNQQLVNWKALASRTSK